MAFPLRSTCGGGISYGALLYEMAGSILKIIMKENSLPILKPMLVAAHRISSFSNLCTALDIAVTDFEKALSLDGNTRYIQKTVPKPNGDKRIVYKPHWLIRKIQRRLNNRFFANENCIIWPKFVYGSIPNQETSDGTIEAKDYISCAQKHCLARSALSVDIKDFFGNIHKDRVKEIFEKILMFDPESAHKCASICCHNDSLTQGALTSSYIANLALFDVEGEIFKRLKRKNLRYTRYIDDITVSTKASNYDFAFAENIIRHFLESLDLPINEAKTKIQHTSTSSIKVHGLRVNFEQPRLPAGEPGKIRAAVKNMETLSKEHSYRTSHAYRKDFNRCMGRVNKLHRVGHKQHTTLLNRLLKILPLPSKKDIERTENIIKRLEHDHPKKRSEYWYKKRFYLAHERLNILQRSFPKISIHLRERLKAVKHEYKA
ncbi:reverse transcriptase family protein [Alcanivoracaceae bacterium MT1]